MDPRRLSPYARSQEKTKPDERRQSRKNRAVPLRTHRPAGVGNPAARRTDAPRPRGRLPPLRHSALRAPPGVGGHLTRVDAALSPQRTHCAHSPTAPGPRPIARRRAGDCRAHRTAQAREPASGSPLGRAPRYCASWRRLKPARYRPPRSTVSCAPADLLNVSYYSTKPPPTRSTKPSLPIRPGSRTCCSARGFNAPAAAKCRYSCRPRSTTPAASFRTPSSIPTRDWTRFLMPAPGPRRARPSHAPLHG